MPRFAGGSRFPYCPCSRLRASYESENAMNHFTPGDPDFHRYRSRSRTLADSGGTQKANHCTRMKVPVQITAAVRGLVVLLAAGLFSGGCAAPSGSAIAPKPGKG